MELSPRTPSSYIPADRDTEFLQRDELRPLRIGIELLKAELIQREQGIRSTIVVFGIRKFETAGRSFRQEGAPCG
jgi:hypothetical protein